MVIASLDTGPLERTLLEASGLSIVDITYDELGDVASQVVGVCVGGPSRTRVASAAALNDGLAKAVGFSDTLATAGVPGYFGFASRVYGLVEAVREVMGERYVGGEAAVLGSGPDAWAALAAFTQLRVDHLVAYVEPRDALTQAVAHRLGLDLDARPVESCTGADLVLDARMPSLNVHGVDCWDVVGLHTVAAQIKVLTSKQPNLNDLRNVL